MCVSNNIERRQFLRERQEKQLTEAIEWIVGRDRNFTAKSGKETDHIQPQAVATAATEYGQAEWAVIEEDYALVDVVAIAGTAELTYWQKLAHSKGYTGAWLDRLYITAPIFEWVESSTSTPTQQFGFDHDMISIQVVDQEFEKEEILKQTCVLPEVLETKQYTDTVEKLLTDAVSSWDHDADPREQLLSIQMQVMKEYCDAEKKWTKQSGKTSSSSQRISVAIAEHVRGLQGSRDNWPVREGGQQATRHNVERGVPEWGTLSEHT